MANQDTVASLVKDITDAKGDVEKFAALLSVLTTSALGNCTESEKRAIFDALGLDFLSRILRKYNVSSESPAYAYKSVVLCIFRAFATDEDLCTSPEMLVNIPIFFDILQQNDKSQSELAIKRDTCLLLGTIASYPKGLESMANHSALDIFRELLVRSKFQSTHIFPLFLTLFKFNAAPSPPDYPSSIQDFILKLSFQFSCEKGDLKFKLCSFLNALLVSVKTYDFTDEFSWKRNVNRGLYDILTSRISIEMKDEGLALFSTMLALYGFPKNAEDNAPETSDLTAIAVNLSCVELRMKLEDRDLDQVVAAGDSVVTCYCIVEHAIKELLIEDTNQNRKIQMYSVIKGAASAIIDFLSRVWKETGELWCELGNNKLIVILASFRALGAWLAEETEAWRQEVYDILPFLIGATKQPDIFNSVCSGIPKLANVEEGVRKIKSATLSQAFSCQSVPLQFLLPAFCHFSSEETSLNIMFEHDVPELLFKELQHLWGRLHPKNSITERQDSETALITIGGIFMNMIVLRSEDCSTRPVFSSLLEFCLKCSLVLTENKKDFSELDSFILIQGHIFVMGLMLLQNDLRRPSKKPPHILSLSFINTCINFLEGAHVCEAVEISSRLTVAPLYRRHWDGLMDLWFLGMQCLQTLVVEVPHVGNRIWETNWLQNVLSNVTPGCLEGNERCAFDGLLATLAKNTPSVASNLNNSHIKILCDVHGLQELKKVISRPSISDIYKQPTAAEFDTFEV